MDEKTPAPVVLILVRDLIFSAKIIATARAANVAVQSLRDPSHLADRPADRLIVDLNQDGALDAAIAWRRKTGRPVIGFVSHVDTDTIIAARNAGIDRVLARSQFVQILPQLLGGTIENRD